MASNCAMAASITAAAAVLSDWTANMSDDPQLEECGRHRFLIAGSLGGAVDFWQWLALPFGGDSSFLHGRAVNVDLNGGCVFLNSVEDGALVWVKWPDSVEDEVRVVDVEDGILVSWTPRGEAELSVAGALAAYVVREGLALRPYEEPEED